MSILELFESLQQSFSKRWDNQVLHITFLFIFWWFLCENWVDRNLMFAVFNSTGKHACSKQKKRLTKAPCFEARKRGGNRISGRNEKNLGTEYFEKGQSWKCHRRRRIPPSPKRWQQHFIWFLGAPTEDVFLDGDGLHVFWLRLFFERLFWGRIFKNHCLITNQSSRNFYVSYSWISARFSSF